MKYRKCSKCNRIIEGTITKYFLNRIKYNCICGRNCIVDEGNNGFTKQFEELFNK